MKKLKFISMLVALLCTTYIVAATPPKEVQNVEKFYVEKNYTGTGQQQFYDVGSLQATITVEKAVTAKVTSTLAKKQKHLVVYYDATVTANNSGPGITTDTYRNINIIAANNITGTDTSPSAIKDKDYTAANTPATDPDTGDLATIASNNPESKGFATACAFDKLE